MSWTVTSDKVAGHEPGDAFDPPPGVNVAALVAAGHVKRTPTKATEATKKGK